MKARTFTFGIIPAKLTKENLSLGKAKKAKDGSVTLKGMMYKPSASGATKSVKLKYNKQESKTDYVTVPATDGTVTVTGKNNFYGSVSFKP